MGVHDLDPFADRRQVLARASRLAGTPADRWRYYNQRIYLERGQAAWVASARAAGVSLVFPFLHPEVLGWAAARLHGGLATARKPALAEVGRKIALSSRLVQRPKLSFGPVAGSPWLSQLTAASHLVADLLPADSLERVLAADSGEYVFWNLLTYAVWQKTVLEVRPAEEVKSCINVSEAGTPRR
jgi:hypothetical protein